MKVQSKHFQSRNIEIFLARHVNYFYINQGKFKNWLNLVGVLMTIVAYIAYDEV